MTELGQGVGVRAHYPTYFKCKNLSRIPSKQGDEIWLQG